MKTLMSQAQVLVGLINRRYISQISQIYIPPW